MIKISDRFYINATVNCYTLQEKTTIKDAESKNYGQAIFREIGYYTTLKDCIKGILKVKTREFIRKEEVNSLHELLEEIKRIDKSLQETIKA